jgi:predicted Fe-Mo cluster-binding NifX family protein
MESMKAGTMKAALATDDGATFMDRHFGDAKYFDIYDIDNSSQSKVKRIDNTIEEDESIHADPRKAGGITGILKAEGVQVVISKVFGPNIMRIKKHFVCVRMDDATVDEALRRLSEHGEAIRQEWQKGEERGFLNLMLSRDPSGT